MSLSNFISFPPSPPSSLYKESVGRRGSMMESAFQNAFEDSNSLPARSRAGTVSSNNQLGLQQFESPRSLNLASPALSSAESAYLSPLPQDPSNYLPTPVSNSYTPFSALSPELLDADWSAQPSREPAAPTPTIKVEQGRAYSSSPQATAVSCVAATGAMSAVATIPFDPTYSMGGRTTFSWPGLHGATTDTSTHLLGHDLTTSLGHSHHQHQHQHHGSDATLTPPSTSRSITASPPRASLTPEHREIKRQMDQARRDSKSVARIRRSNSNPYAPDSSSAALGSMPVYTTAPAPISLLAEPTAMPTQTYLPSYSPPSTSVSSMPSLYPTAYQQPASLSHSYNMGLDYSGGFQHSSSYGRGRPGQLGMGSDSSNNLMYHVPAVMATGGGPTGAAAESANHGGSHVRVVQSRPKPQCWEHGCNGRQFSTFSNLLRHQREKSGQATKATCPNCGAEFTRTTARNGHLLHDKCKQQQQQQQQRRNNSTGGMSSAGSNAASPPGGSGNNSTGNI